MGAKMKPRRMWAVEYRRGDIDPHSIRPLRRQAIEAFCDYPTANWPHWRKKGCRAVRVLVTQEPPCE